MTTVRTLFACGVNDPVTCLHAHASTGFAFFGTVTGSVRAVFPSNQATSRQVADSKADPALPYSLIVLTRRSEEGVRSIHVDSHGFVFATVGDRHVNVWDLSNLKFDRPLVLGAVHDELPYSRTHTYTRCINTYVLQSDDGTIGMLTTGGHTMQVISRHNTVQSPAVAVADGKQTSPATSTLPAGTDAPVDATEIVVSAVAHGLDEDDTTVAPLTTTANDSVSAHENYVADGEDETSVIVDSDANATTPAQHAASADGDADTTARHDNTTMTRADWQAPRHESLNDLSLSDEESTPAPRLSLASAGTLAPDDNESNAAATITDADEDGLYAHQPPSVSNAYSNPGFDPFDEPCGSLVLPHVHLQEERLEFGLPRGTVPMSLTDKYISWVQSERPDHYVASVWNWREGTEGVYETCASLACSNRRRGDLALALDRLMNIYICA
jgi:hypothetical protein